LFATPVLLIAPAADAAEPLMRDFIGLNGHTVQFRPALYSPVASRVRDYHNLDWDLGSNTSNDTQFPFAANRVNWDTLYGGWKNEGFRVDVCIQFGGIEETEWTNMAADAKKYGRALADHFGPTAGNGLIETVQIGNEPGNYSDANYRIVFQNMAEGIREVDPSLKIMTCAATAGPSGQYAKSLEVFKGLGHLVDVYDLHTYAHKTGWPTWEPSYPEDPQLAYLKNVRDVIAWRDRNDAGKRVSVSEFGYDSTTKPNYTTGTFKDWKGVTDLQQAQYLTRSYLAFSEMDVDRAHMFWFNDNDTPQLFGSSGLTRNYEPKPSYFAVEQLQSVLGDYRFDRVVRKVDGDVYVYAYTSDADPDQTIWAIWSPTGSGREVVMTLDGLVGMPLSAQRMALADGVAPSVAYEWLGDGRVRLAVSESPTYLVMAVPEPATAAVGLVFASSVLLASRTRGRVR
jgi:hypothetical protein